MLVLWMHTADETIVPNEKHIVNYTLFDVTWKWTSGVVEMDFEALSTSNLCSVLISHHFEINASGKISTKFHSAGMNSTTILCHILEIQCISREKPFVTKLLSLNQEKLLLPLSIALTIRSLYTVKCEKSIIISYLYVIICLAESQQISMRCTEAHTFSNSWRQSCAKFIRNRVQNETHFTIHPCKWIHFNVFAVSNSMPIFLQMCKSCGKCCAFP